MISERSPLVSRIVDLLQDAFQRGADSFMGWQRQWRLGEDDCKGNITGSIRDITSSCLHVSAKVVGPLHL